MLSSRARASKVMVVDPDRAVLEMPRIRLDVAGNHRLAARSGVGALEILRHTRPAALVLDTAVAEMDAFDVLALIGPVSQRPAASGPMDVLL
jgi:CheY-like chemotaxis protein